MMNEELHRLSVRQLQQAVTDGVVDTKEINSHFKRRIEQFENDKDSTNSINCFIARDIEAEGGIPIAHKDIFCTKNMATTCASKMLKDFIPPYSATLVQRLQKDGYVMLAKTNMDEFAMGSSNETSFFGAVKNPWDKTKVPGGSSGGSAAAVAARLIPAASATDTGGSIRQPAAFCGVVGLKPTYGRISRFGQIAFSSSLDQAGFIATTVEDCALLLQSTAGHDECDHTSSTTAVDDYVGGLSHSIAGRVIAVPEEYFELMDSHCAVALESALKIFEKQGATLKKVSMKNLHLALSVYQIISSAECSANLARYDGVRYSYRCEDPVDIDDLFYRSRSEGFGPEVKRRILLGTYVLASEQYASHYLRAKKLQQVIANEFADVFETADVIATPTTPTTAFALGEKLDDSMQMYQSDIFTSSVNLARLPAVSIPAGFSKKLPIGLQLIGTLFNESTLLNIAHQFQMNSDFHTHVPPGYE